MRFYLGSWQRQLRKLIVFLTETQLVCVIISKENKIGLKDLALYICTGEFLQQLYF